MSAIMAMKRTTIMADERLLSSLREIAKDEGLSLGEVIRQGLEWRVQTRRRVPSFISKPLPPTGARSDAARRVDELVAEAIAERHARH